MGTFLSPVMAKTKIKSVYFNSEQSLVFEAEEQLEFFDYKYGLSDGANTFVLEFPDAHLSGRVKKELSNNDYKIKIKEEKIDDGRFFFGDDHVVKVFIETSDERLGFSNREILEGEAYEISFHPKGVVEKYNLPKALDSEIVTEEIEAAPGSKTEEFVSELNREIIDETISTREFQDYKKEKLDATNLQLIADALSQAGHKDQALDAYRKSAEIDPENLNARVGIAKNTTDPQEKLSNYLKTIKTEALVAVGDSWMQSGMENSNPKTIAAALLSLQYAVLKEPLNPNLRYKYAKALQRSGEDNYAQATKRFLEAAAISKKQFLHGDRTVEPLMRNAVESLIKILAIQGEFKNAAKYCKSYLSLGYKKFLTGDPIAAIEKKVKSNKNPFGFDTLDI